MRTKEIKEYKEILNFYGVELEGELLKEELLNNTENIEGVNLIPSGELLITSDYIPALPYSYEVEFREFKKNTISYLGSGLFSYNYIDNSIGGEINGVFKAKKESLKDIFLKNILKLKNS